MGKMNLSNPSSIPNDGKIFDFRQNTIKKIKKYGIAAEGRAELIAHLSGKRLTRDRAIWAFCYSCMGHYADGKDDCMQLDCPLHPFMPYAKRNNVLAAPAQGLPAKNTHASDRLHIHPSQNAILNAEVQ